MEKDMTKPNITGHWVSPGVEIRKGANGMTLFLRRDFHTDATRSTARLLFYADPEGKVSTLTLHLEGPYEILGPSSLVSGAWEADFHFDRAKVTAHNDFFVDLLNSAPPGKNGTQKWVAGVEQDVTATRGCVSLGLDIDAKNTEYDLVKREGERLSYGARPDDGGLLDTRARRPKALQAPLVRG